LRRESSQDVIMIFGINWKLARFAGVAIAGLGALMLQNDPDALVKNACNWYLRGSPPGTICPDFLKQLVSPVFLEILLLALLLFITWPVLVRAWKIARNTYVTTVSVLGIAWRIHKKKQEQPAEIVPPNSVSPMSTRGDTLVATATVSDPPEFNADHIYVGRMIVEIEHANDDGFVIFRITGFNGSGNSINFLTPKGVAIFNETVQGIGTKSEKLPVSPFYVDDTQTENILPAREFYLHLEQRVSKSVVLKLKAMEPGNYCNFMFGQLDIPIQSIRWQTIGRLRAWDGVSIGHNTSPLTCGRIIQVSLGESVTASSSQS
jgi:hypothetical protein